MTKVIVSILHYGHIKDTLECLESIKNSDLKNISIEIFILDNSPKQEFKIGDKEFDNLNVTVLKSSINTGFAMGHNLVYEKIQDKDFDFFLILNNDCLLDKHCIKYLADSFENKKIGAVVPKIYFTKGYEFHKGKYLEHEKGNVIWFAGGEMDWENIQSKHIGVDEVDKGQFDEVKSIDFANGACLLVKKEVLKKVGLFNEKYFLYFEDADLSQRILKNGYQILYVPKAVAWHNNAGSSSSGSELHDYYLTRNRMLFGMKYAPLKMKVLLLKESIRLLRNGRKWQKIGIQDYYLRKLGRGGFFT
jgi:GT2 family glycosyltransferase